MLVFQLRGREGCSASTGAPEPRQARVELVKIYDVDANISRLAALYIERGEAQARPGLSSKAADERLVVGHGSMLGSTTP